MQTFNSLVKCWKHKNLWDNGHVAAATWLSEWSDLNSEGPQTWWNVLFDKIWSIITFVFNFTHSLFHGLLSLLRHCRKTLLVWHSIVLMFVCSSSVSSRTLLHFYSLLQADFLLILCLNRMKFHIGYLR